MWTVSYTLKNYMGPIIDADSDLLPIQPIGRGATIALNGSWGRPCSFFNVS